MARLRVEVTARPDLVASLAAKHALVGQCEADALRHAIDAGLDLLQVPPAERAALAEAAGVGRSSRFEYVQLAEHREQVQRAGLSSKRQALALIRRSRPTRVGPFLWPDWLDLFEASRIRSIDYVTFGGERRTIDR